jgi:hypothetical protein
MEEEEEEEEVEEDGSGYSTSVGCCFSITPLPHASETLIRHPLFVAVASPF